MATWLIAHFLTCVCVSASLLGQVSSEDTYIDVAPLTLRILNIGNRRILPGGSAGVAIAAARGQFTNLDSTWKNCGFNRRVPDWPNWASGCRNEFEDTGQPEPIFCFTCSEGKTVRLGGKTFIVPDEVREVKKANGTRYFSYTKSTPTPFDVIKMFNDVNLTTPKDLRPNAGGTVNKRSNLITQIIVLQTEAMRTTLSLPKLKQSLCPNFVESFTSLPEQYEGNEKEYLAHIARFGSYFVQMSTAGASYTLINQYNAPEQRSLMDDGVPELAPLPTHLLMMPVVNVIHQLRRRDLGNSEYQYESDNGDLTFRTTLANWRAKAFWSPTLISRTLSGLDTLFNRSTGFQEAVKDAEMIEQAKYLKVAIAGLDVTNFIKTALTKVIEEELSGGLIRPGFLPAIWKTIEGGNLGNAYFEIGCPGEGAIQRYHVLDGLCVSSFITGIMPGCQEPPAVTATPVQDFCILFYDQDSECRGNPRILTSGNMLAVANSIGNNASWTSCTLP